MWDFNQWHTAHGAVDFAIYKERITEEHFTPERDACLLVNGAYQTISCCDRSCEAVSGRWLADTVLDIQCHLHGTEIGFIRAFRETVRLNAVGNQHQFIIALALHCQTDQFRRLMAVVVNDLHIQVIQQTPGFYQTAPRNPISRGTVDMTLYRCVIQE